MGGRRHANGRISLCATGAGPALCARAGALLRLWPSRGTSPLGSEVATDHERARTIDRLVCPPVELEGDGGALAGGLEDRRKNDQKCGRLGRKH